MAKKQFHFSKRKFKYALTQSKYCEYSCLRFVIGVRKNMPLRQFGRDFVLQNVSRVFRMRKGNLIEKIIPMQIRKELLSEPNSLAHITSFRFSNCLALNVRNVERQIGDYSK